MAVTCCTTTVLNPVAKATAYVSLSVASYYPSASYWKLHAGQKLLQGCHAAVLVQTQPFSVSEQTQLHTCGTPLGGYMLHQHCLPTLLACMRHHRAVLSTSQSSSNASPLLLDLTCGTLLRLESTTNALRQMQRASAVAKCCKPNNGTGPKRDGPPHIGMLPWPALQVAVICCTTTASQPPCQSCWATSQHLQATAWFSTFRKSVKQQCWCRHNPAPP